MGSTTPTGREDVASCLRTLSAGAIQGVTPHRGWAVAVAIAAMTFLCSRFWSHAHPLIAPNTATETDPIVVEVTVGTVKPGCTTPAKKVSAVTPLTRYCSILVTTGVVSRDVIGSEVGDVGVGVGSGALMLSLS